MRNGWVCLLCGCLTLLCMPGGASARTIQDRIVLSLEGEAAEVFMSDLNRLIAQRHCAFITREANAGLKSVPSAFGAGAGLEYGVTDYLLAGVHFEALLPATELRIGSWLNPDRVYHIGLDALVWSLGLKGAWPKGKSWLFTLGGEVGYLILSHAGEYHKVRNWPGFPGAMHTTEQIDYHGWALSWKLTAGADLFLFDFWSLFLQTGFRYARVGEVTGTYLSGQEAVLRNPDGSNFTLDYGGIFLKSGFKFWF